MAQKLTYFNGKEREHLTKHNFVNEIDYNPINLTNLKVTRYVNDLDNYNKNSLECSYMSISFYMACESFRNYPLEDALNILHTMDNLEGRLSIFIKP